MQYLLMKDWKVLHQQVLNEILERRVQSSRGRRNPRGVKRKMSNSPVRRRKDGGRLHVRMHITVKILK